VLKKQGSTILPVLVLALLLVGIQIAASASGRAYYLTQLIMTAYYSIVVLGLCLVMGYCGQVSLGHAAFFAIGGYASAILTTLDIAAARDSEWGQVLQSLHILSSWKNAYGEQILAFAPWAAFVVALLLTLIIALLIGYPALRLKGHYLAMATLGFGLIVYRIVLGSAFTGAADGITGVPGWSISSRLVITSNNTYRVANYYFAWGVTLVVLVFLLNLVHSRVGRALRSIHDGELAANAMGIHTAGYKLQAFVISAMLAATAGSFFTHYTGGIGPSEAGVLKSIRYVVLVAAGGMANLWGGLIISALLNFLSLRGYFGMLDHAVFGVILIAIVSLAPEGPLRPLGLGIRRALHAMNPQKRTEHGPVRS
jgi:branched-chain amino acid transport system permease protein